MFGEYPPPFQHDAGGLSLALEMREGHYQYTRALGRDRMERAISVGLSRLLVHPVNPFNTGPEPASHLEVEFPPLILEAGATETIFLTFPIEVGVFVEGLRDTEVLDIFSPVPPKFSLYGPTHGGIITRFTRSQRHRDIPPVDGCREGVLKLTIRNTLNEWIRVSRVVMNDAEMHLYMGEWAGMVAAMKVTGRERAEVTGLDLALKGGMRRAHDLFTARRILKLSASPHIPGVERKGFFMEAGFS